MMRENYEEVWKLPFRSQEFLNGPQLIHTVTGVRLRLDYETETGEYAWKSLSFKPIYAVRFTTQLSCTPDQLHAYDKLVAVDPAEWLSTMSGIPDDCKHYRVFFDDVGCYDIAAKSFEVVEDEA